MPHSKLPWELESPCGFPYSGIFIVPKVRKDFPCHIAQIRQLREREESEANANLIVTAVNVMPEVKRIIKGLLQLNESFPTGVDSVDAELFGYIQKGHELLEKLEGA